MAALLFVVPEASGTQRLLEVNDAGFPLS